MFYLLSRRLTYVFITLALLCGVVAILPRPAHASGDSVDEIHYSYGETPDSVVFDWRGLEQTIYYGLDATYGAQATAAKSSVMPVDNVGPFQEVKLTGLQPGTAYHYKIGLSGLDHVMATTPTTDFNWVDIGDTASTLCSPWMAQTQSLVAQQNPNFVTHGGDISYANECGPAAVHQYFVDQEVWSHSAAFQPVWGNHEYGPVNSDSLPGAVRDSMANYKGRVYITNAQTVANDTSTQINNPGCGWETGSKVNTCKGEDWGWFVTGHVLFISYPEPWLTAQVTWGTQAAALMASAQANPNIDFIVTYGHRPAYTSLIGAESTDLRNSVNALAKVYSPTATNPNGKYILNIGHHIHGEEAFAPINGLVNITNGGGGAGQTSFSNPGDPNSIFKTVHPGILSASYSASQHKLSLNLLCGPDYTPSVKQHCTYGSVLYSQSFTRPVTQSPPPVLQTTVSDNVSSVQVGQSVTYNLTTTNSQAGSTAASGVSVSATIPANVTIVNTFGGTVTGNQVTWIIGSLAAGQSATQQLTLQPTSGTSLTVTAQVTTTDTSCTNSGSSCIATDTDIVTTPLPPVVQVTASDGGNSVQLNQQTTYSLTTANTQSGATSAAGVTLTATIPDNATLINAFGGTVVGNTVSWYLGDLAANQSITEQLVLQVVSGSTLMISAQATTNDSSCSNIGSTCVASDSDSVTLPPPPVIQTSVSDGVSSTQIGQSVTYSLITTSTQPGSVSILGVSLSATIPDNATIINTYGGIVNGNVVTWALGDFAPGQVSIQQLSLQVTGGSSLDLSSSITTNDTTCTNSGSICSGDDSDTVVIPPPAIIQTSISDGVSTIQVGQQLTYSLSTTNTQIGGTTATGVTLTATIPDNATLINAFGGTVVGNMVSWYLGDLTAGQVLTEQLALQPSSGTTLVLQSQLTTTDTSCQGTGAICAATDTDSVTTPPPAVMSTSITDGVASVQSGQQVTYSFSVGNTQNGSNPSGGVTMSIILPSNASVTNAFGGTVTGNVVSWTVGSLAAGQSVTKQLSLQANGGTSLVVTVQTTTTDTSCATAGSVCAATDTDTVIPLPPPFKQWVLNQGAEIDLSGWTGKYGASSFVTVTRDTTVSHSGVASIKITGLTGANSLSSGFNDNPRWVVKTTAGTVYTQSAWVDATFVGQKISLRLREWNSTGTTLITDKLVTVTATTVGWQQITQTLTAAGTNDQLSFAVYAVISAGQNLYVDDMSLTTPS